MSICTLIYLACLPFGWRAYKDYERKDAEAAAQASPEGAAAEAPAAAELQSPAGAAPGAAPGADDRPVRLN